MSYRYPNTLIIVFCKAPILNQVKTRLMPNLTAQQAVDAHIELSNRTLELVTSSQLSPIELWCSPDNGHVYFEECVNKYQVSLHEQCDGDLGAKMYHAIRSGLERAEHVVLIGSDCPSFMASDFEQAIEALTKGFDIVLGPAEDGGYVLIGMSRPYQQLFQDITWGSNLVLLKTKHKIKEEQLKLFETQSQWDVDYFTDWLRYQHINDV